MLLSLLTLEVLLLSARADRRTVFCESRFNLLVRSACAVATDWGTPPSHPICRWLFVQEA